MQKLVHSNSAEVLAETVVPCCGPLKNISRLSKPFWKMLTCAVTAVLVIKTDIRFLNRTNLFHLPRSNICSTLNYF